MPTTKIVKHCKYLEHRGLGCDVLQSVQYSYTNKTIPQRLNKFQYSPMVFMSQKYLLIYFSLDFIPLSYMALMYTILGI